MTTIRVSALDTAQAMDEIAAKLGADAMIIDTFKRDGKIEMIATDNAEEHFRSESQMVSGHSSAKVLPYEPREKDIHLSAAEAMAEMQRADEEHLPRFNEIFDQKMVNTTPVSEAETAPAARSTYLGTSADNEALRRELGDIKAMLSGMMITQPSGLREQFGHTAAVQLRQSGFSEKIITELKTHFGDGDNETAKDAFINAIAQKLVRTDTTDLLERRLICVVGSSGSGKTTLASKIAAYCKEHAIIDRIMLGAATGKGVNASDEIKDFARLMNMKSINFSVDELAVRMRETSNRMIVDISAAPEQAVDAITACCRDLGAGKVAVVQALPGGSSATLISHQCAHYFGLDPMIALTKLDECEAMPAELSALAMDGSGIGLLTGTKSIVGGIAIATSQILTQYLRENA